MKHRPNLVFRIFLINLLMLIALDARESKDEDDPVHSRIGRCLEIKVKFTVKTKFSGGVVFTMTAIPFLPKASFSLH